MKSTILLTVLAAATSTVNALSGVGAHGPVFFSRRGLHQRLAHVRRRLPEDLHRRKTPLGPDDTTTEPSNIAQGTLGAAKGCTCWHTVIDGEVCLGLIDKSSAGFDITAFRKYNPQVNSDCSNLVNGQAYCVDDGENGAAPVTKEDNTAAPSPVTQPQPVASAKQLAKQTSTDDDDEDCDDDDETEDTEDDEDCEEDDSDGLDAPISRKVQSTTSDDSDDDQQQQSSDASQSSSDDQDQQQPNSGSAPSDSNSSSSSDDSSSGNNSSSNDDGDKAQFSGTATWYEQNGNPGNCGNYNQDSALIVALYTEVYANGQHCGEKVKLTNKQTGASLVATVADSCPSCERSGNIDLSVKAFSDLTGGNMGQGVFDIDWSFI